MDLPDINAFRVALIARHTNDTEAGITANMCSAYMSIHRAVTAVDQLLESCTEVNEACDLTHLRARLFTAGSIIREEVKDLAEAND